LASNNDYIEEMPLGDFTQLNTIEYKYFGFYQRIRQQLEQYWGDSLRQRAELLFRAGRSIASNKSHVTSLSITIDSQGQIRRIKVNSPSGVKELDEAAVESFNKAGPFPNPPRELVKDGEATIQWGFVVKS
jgi:TonB family protein